MKLNFRCTKSKQGIIENDICSICQLKYRREDGILIFSHKDLFYDGKYVETRNFKDVIFFPEPIKSFLYKVYVNLSMATKYESFFRKELKT